MYLFRKNIFLFVSKQKIVFKALWLDREWFYIYRLKLINVVKASRSEINTAILFFAFLEEYFFAYYIEIDDSNLSAIRKRLLLHTFSHISIIYYVILGYVFRINLYLLCFVYKLRQLHLIITTERSVYYLFVECDKSLENDFAMRKYNNMRFFRLSST